MQMYNLGFMGMILVVSIFGVYFLPTLIAFLRRQKNKLAIFFLNILLGWTGIGWTVALVWSVMR